MPHKQFSSRGRTPANGVVLQLAPRVPGTGAASGHVPWPRTREVAVATALGSFNSACPLEEVPFGLGNALTSELSQYAYYAHATPNNIKP